MIQNKIAIIDLDSVVFSIFHPHKVLDKNGEPLRKDNKFVYQEKTEEEILQAVDFWMNKILTDSGATHYIGYIKGSGNFRYNIDPNYKGNRSSEKPKYWELVKTKLMNQWGAVEVNDIEVDDACLITKTHFENIWRNGKI